MPRIRTFALVAVLLLAAAPPARADGDPPSDYLVQQDMYYGYGLDLKSKAAAQLPALLAQAHEKGYEIRVALIASDADLGSAALLFQKPQLYAEFLGQELSNVYKGRTLVVMPNGYGIFHTGHSNVREKQVLKKLPPPGDLLTGSLDAVQKLAAASDVSLTVPDVAPPPGGVKQPALRHRAIATATAPPAQKSGGGGHTWLFLVPVAGFVVIALVLRRRARSA